MTDTPRGATKASEFQRLRAVAEVVAGIIPGTPEPEFTRRYPVTSLEWQACEEADRGALLAERNGTALGYAAMLMASPHRLNWVRVDWIWF